MVASLQLRPLHALSAALLLLLLQQSAFSGVSEVYTSPPEAVIEEGEYPNARQLEDLSSPGLSTQMLHEKSSSSSSADSGVFAAEGAPLPGGDPAGPEGSGSTEAGRRFEAHFNLMMEPFSNEADSHKPRQVVGFFQLLPQTQTAEDAPLAGSQGQNLHQILLQHSKALARSAASDATTHRNTGSAQQRAERAVQVLLFALLGYAMMILSQTQRKLNSALQQRKEGAAADSSTSSSDGSQDSQSSSNGSNSSGNNGSSNNASGNDGTCVDSSSRQKQQQQQEKAPTR